MNRQNDTFESCFSPITLTVEDAGRLLRPRPVDAHKGTMGHALIVAGSLGMAGASILACRGCLRSGVGKLTLHAPRANNVILQCTVPEAILRADEDEKLVTKPFPTSAFQAIGMGPGLGTSEQTAEAVHLYLQTTASPMVLDADALNIIATHQGWEKDIPKNAILTPHAGEFQRLTRRCDSIDERLRLSTDYATEHQVYIVMKGHPSIVCTPEGETFLCPYGNSGMATPGSGDVLTGIITGLLAQGYPPLDATLLGVWLHAIAGDYAADELGEESMLASDIITHLPHAFRALKGHTEQSSQ